MQSKRIEAFDILRGIALMFIILFHSSIYNYANIHRIDFSNPPIIVVLMSFMALWGGIFIIYSMIVNTIKLLERSESKIEKKMFFHSVIVGFVYLFFHYILNIFLGRWNTDFVNNKPDMTVIASSLRNLEFSFPHITKLFEGSSLSTIALNIIIVSILLFLLFRNGGVKKERRNYIILGSLGSFLMLVSFLRVPIYNLFEQAIDTNNYVLATFFSFTIAHPYPLLPYLAYGIFGALIGMLIYFQRKEILKKVILPVGLLFFAYGLWGVLNLEKSISTPDYFWYFKTHFELGIFILMMLFTYFVVQPRVHTLGSMKVVSWFSRVSLTVYMLETTTSEIFIGNMSSLKSKSI